MKITAIEPTVNRRETSARVQRDGAPHLQEPLRNYGVGGYSVHQAYRRMRKVYAEEGSTRYIILNIFDDDHYRNLVPWLRFKRPPYASRQCVRRLGDHEHRRELVESQTPALRLWSYRQCVES